MWPSISLQVLLPIAIMTVLDEPASGEDDNLENSIAHDFAIGQLELEALGTMVFNVASSPYG